VFGSGDETLEDVVVRQLNLNHQTIAVVDFGFNGDIAAALSRAQAAAERRPLLGGSYFSPPAELLSPSAAGGLSLTAIFSQHAAEIREQMQTTWGVAVSWPYRKPQEDREYFAVAVTNGDVSQFQEFPHAGHSALRHTRSVKQALNYLRLILLPS
jgi:hypothetical protein